MLQIYSKKNCQFCDLAKALLSRHAVPFTELRVDEDHTLREFLVAQGHRSVPQIFHNGQVIPGGYQGLSAMSVEEIINLGR